MSRRTGIGQMETDGEVEVMASEKNMINKINKERRRSMNATPMTQQQEPMARSPGGPQTEVKRRSRNHHQVLTLLLHPRQISL
jgi:hypothetical protein